MASTSCSALEAAIARAADPTFSSVEIVHSTSPSWPVGSEPTNISHTYTAKGHRPIHISVVDSSFNPPHLAHLGLATSSFPPPYSPASPVEPSIQQESQLPSHSRNTSNEATETGAYNARLLLLSLRNADKSQKPGDATPLQRVEMMILFAQHLDHHHPIWGGTAVGLIHEPTFVGKSRILQQCLSAASSFSHGEDQLTPRLSFPMGTDTLVRFFDPKYYPNDSISSQLASFFDAPPNGDASHLILARRGLGETSEGMERELLARQDIAPWVLKGQVRAMGTAGEGREEISSTEVRNAAKAGDETALEQLVIPSIARYILQNDLYKV